LKDAGYNEEEIQEMLSNQIIFEKKW
jgi:hypothetical protein